MALTTTTTTVTAYRNRTTALKEVFVVLDAGIPSFWQPAPEDTITKDNGGTFLRTKGSSKAAGFGARRLYEGSPRASWFGIVPGLDAAPKLQAYIDSLPANEPGGALIFEPGRYPLSHTVNLRHTALGLYSEGDVATFWAMPSLTYPLLTSEGSQHIVDLERIGFVGHGYEEFRNEDGSRVYPNDPRYRANALVVLKDVHNVNRCEFMETGGVAIVAEGYISQGSNTSGSRIHNQNRFSRIGGHGFYPWGSDSNAYLVDGANDFRDSGGAVCDDSLLGGTVLGNMVHYGKLGPFMVLNATAITNVVFNYCEAGTDWPDHIMGAGFVAGNRHSGTPEIGRWVTFYDTNGPLYTSQERYGVEYTTQKNADRPIEEIGIAGAPIKKWYSNEERPTTKPWRNFPRGIHLDGHGFGRSVLSISEAQHEDYPSDLHDIIFSQAEGWCICTSAGNGGRTLEGVTGSVTPNTGGNMLVSGRIDQLNVGFTLAVASYRVKVVGLHADANGGGIALIYPGISEMFENQPVRFAAPEFKPLY